MTDYKTRDATRRAVDAWNLRQEPMRQMTLGGDA